MTNFDHFGKPIVHFGSSQTSEPEKPAAPAPSLLHFASEPKS
ncbi:hypothetical protein SEA_FUZZBUSTER_15 [Microbacterium phage FuzzBuster]|uniref:Uncharacterized protein n=1 Tax=Microbacterium phage FuzzBuster TaxID=2590935 RepID=A0A516KUY6_9CAUD|nr:hypothetical protein SEA_FUZZBUSTER_15 [Microbacterium phage FuzzBuster]